MMKNDFKPFRPKRTQLLTYSQRLKKSLESGKFTQFSKRKQERVVKRIERLQRQLNNRMPGFQKSTAFALSTLVLGLAASTVKAQPSYIAPVDTPFGLNLTSMYVTLSDVAFADLDADGDLDAVTVDSAGYALFSMRYLENTGSATAPAFTPAANNIFDPVTFESLSFLDLVDMDMDGDADLVFLTFDYTTDKPLFIYRQNIGTPMTPVFDTASVNPFGILLDSTSIYPTFGDMDNDGDMDLLLGAYDGAFKYHENVGTAMAPSFGPIQTNPFDLDSAYYINFPTLVDFDRDGDLDILSGSYYGSFEYFENLGTASVASFAASQSNPFGLTDAYYFAAPTVADLDGDGDLDLVVAQYSYYSGAGFLYYEDTATFVGIPAPIANDEWEVYPNPASGKFTVDIQSEAKGEIDFELINGIGQVVRADTWKIYAHGLRKEINVNGLAPGMYFVRLETGDTPMIKKIVLK